MLLTDIFGITPEATWDHAVECGVRHGVIKLPNEFDTTSLADLSSVVDRFKQHGITPKILEPLPNSLHDHIKLGDALRDALDPKLRK